MKIRVKTGFCGCISVWVACILFCINLQAQSIQGKVLEMNGKPLPYVNVLLLNSNDSSLVKGAVSDETGDYRIDNIYAGTYLLAATMVGYKMTYASPVIINKSDVEVKAPVLTLSDDVKQLNEVIVVTTRPFIVQEIDRTVVNVANSIVSSGSTALEVLEKAPGVTVDRQNDGIALRGKDGVIVQIDGKPTYLAMADVVALLRNMPSDNIDNIELITNPSAKYDAAGNAGIINIWMKKNNNVGTNGSASIAAGSGRHDREQGSLQINHRTHTLNLFANYSANRGRNYWDFELQRDWSEGGERNVVESLSPLRFRGSGHNAKAGADYFVGKNTTLGVVWTGQWISHREKGPSDVSFRHGPSEPVYLQTHTEKALYNISYNQVVNFNFQHSLGQKGGQLTADFDLGYFRREFENYLLTATVFPEKPGEPLSGLFTEMPTAIDIRMVKVDYNRAWRDHWKLEAGFKSSSVRSDNNMSLNSGETENLQPDSALSNHFQYTERVNAAYVSLAGKLGTKTEVQVGLRAEHTHSLSHSLTQNNQVRRDYLDFFPSMFLTRPLTQDHTLTLSYSYRIDRPNYQNLNPARSYLDPFAYSRGNPYLKPQYTHSLELRHGFRHSVFTSLGASYTIDLVFYLIQPVDLNRFERTPDNIGTSQAYNLTVSFPVTILPSWTLQTTLMGVYGQFRYTYLDTPHTVRQMSGRLNGTNSFILGGGWTAELSGWVNTPAVDALWHSPWLGSLDVGVQKALGSQWKVKLSVQDLLHTNQIIGYVNTADFDMQARIIIDTRVAMLNLTYSFGNQQLKSVRQRKTGSEEEIQRTN